MRWYAWVVVGALCLGCEEPQVVIEDETPDVITIVEHIWHTTIEEDSTPDVIIQEDSTPDIIVLEDNTPDVVQEFYSDAADLPVFVWEVQGGAPPMPKKFSDLVVATELNDADLFAITQAGTSKQLTALLIRRLMFLDPRYGYVDHTEWLSDVPQGEQNWEETLSGTGAAHTSVADSGRSAVQQSTGTTSSGRATLKRQPLILPQYGKIEMDFGIKIPTLSDGTDRFLTGIGLTDGTNDEIAFQYSDNINSGQWRVRTFSDGANTNYDTSVAVTTGWVHIGIRGNAGGTSVDFLVNGSVVGTINTNIPSGSGSEMYPWIDIAKQLGTTARTQLIDYCQIRQTYTTPR